MFDKDLQDIEQRCRALEVLLQEKEAKLAECKRQVETLGLVIAGTKAGSWDWDVVSGTVAVNDRWAEIVGYIKEELEPVTIETWTRLCHPDDLNHSGALLERHFEGESDFYEIELRMRHKNGDWVWVLDRGMVFERDQDGKPVRMVGTHQDITKRKHTEERLRKERNMFMGGPVSVFRLKNSPGWPVLDVTKNFGTLLGYLPSELTGNSSSYIGLIHPLDRARVIGEASAFAADKRRESFELEYRLKGKDGTDIHVYDFRFIHRDENGAVTHYDSFVLDAASHNGNEPSLSYSRRFERLVTTLANQFINVPVSRIDDMVNVALETIGKFVKADRSYIFQFYDNQRLMDNTHEWCAEGIEPQIHILQHLPTDIFSWLTDKISKNEAIIVPRVSDLPDEATAEREILEQQDIRSLIIIPLVSGNVPFGYIGFDAVTNERQWPLETVSVLKLAGGIIANALQRKHVERLIQCELDLALKLSVSKSFKETLKICLQSALEISGMDCGGIYLVNEADDSLSLAHTEGLTESFVSRTNHYSGDSIQKNIVSRGEAVYSRYSEIDIVTGKPGLEEGLKAIAVVPVTNKKVVVACLNVASHSIEQVPEFSRKALETVASQIGAAIVQAKHEEEINTANRNLDTLFNTIDDMMFIVGTDEMIKHTNSSVLSRLGYSEDEVLRMHVLDFHPPAQRQEARCNIEGMLKGTQNVCLVPLMTKKGDLIPVETIVTHGTWDGHPVIFGISRDITERIKHELAIKESERRFRDLTEFLPLPVVETDSNGVITYCNRQSMAFFGYNTYEMLGRPIYRFVIPSDMPHLESTLQAVFGGKRESTEMTGLRKDGSEFQGMLYAAPVVEDGKVTAGRGVVVDLTEMKKAEASLAAFTLQSRLREELRSIIENIPGAVYRFTADGAIKFFSSVLQPDSGILLPDMNGTLDEAMAVIHPDDREMVVRTIRELMHERGSRVITYRLQNGHDSVRWIEDRKTSAFSEDGEFSFIDGILFDITERVNTLNSQKELESHLRKTQRLETIGTLAGGIAHDFNNILTPIMGYAEMGLLMLSPEDPMYEYFSEIVNAAERSQNLVSQILTFSRAEENTPSVVSVQSILKEALKLLRPSIPATIGIKQHIQDDCRNVLADPSKIHQVVVNLCTNAFHAMEEKGGELGIELNEIVPVESVLKELTANETGCFVKLTVSDTGCGMDDATIERIFEPFFTTKPVNKGTGLGLSVVHGIIKSCGGGITVESRPGKGSSFSVFLPVIEEQQNKGAYDEKPFHGSCRLLIIDDETTTLKMMSAMLTKLGFSVKVFNSSRQAVEIFRHDPAAFDLVITDLTMPELNGIELASAIHEIRGDLPVILMTGYGKEIDNSNSLCRYGISRLLRKPVKLAQLTSAINDVISANYF
ncbi:MAG: PAS domain S-box protein [Chlorobiaceae bacterium]|nr:PAS domain S-box protein [Chlorobiaceae bacterium]